MPGEVESQIRTVEIKPGALANGYLSLTGAMDLFPVDCFGTPKRKGGLGKPITLVVEGLAKPIPTDIPTDTKTRRPRNMFRNRDWVREFYRVNRMRKGDRVVIERVSERDFHVRPVLVDRASKNGSHSLFGSVSLPAPTSRPVQPYKFIDLFAGIGGMRIGFEKAGMECVFTSEWDKHSQQTYEAWFGDKPHGDITQIDPASIPDHDVLAAGFPCQPFSIAGVSKKNALGRAHGFLDETQGTLFFNIAKIIETKRPAAFLLENVKNLRSHDKGRTWTVIRTTLEKLGYRVFDKTIDAAAWVPQHRERIFIVGFDKRRFGSNSGFEFPDAPPGRPPRFRDILDKRVPAKYTLTDHLWKYLQDYAKKHAAKGNGFGFGMTNLDGVSRTMSARYYKDGSEVLIPRGKNKNPRRLTPAEARRLMGFPDDLSVVVSDTQAYRQFGNAVVPKIVAAIAVKIAAVMTESDSRRAGAIEQRLATIAD